MQNNSKIVFLLDRILSVGIFCLVFIAPIKWGLPFLNFDQFILPMNMVEWWVNSWPVEIFVLIVFFLGMVAVVRFIAVGEFKWLLDIWTLLWMGFVLVAWTATGLSVSTRISQHYALLWTAFLVFFILIRQYLSKKAFVISILSSGVIIAVDAIVQKITGLETTLEWARLYYSNDPLFNEIVQKLSSERVFGTFVYPNTLAGYLLMIIPLGAWFLNALFLKREREALKIGSVIFLLSLAGTFFLVSFQGEDGSKGLLMVLILNLISLCILPLAFIVALFMSRSFGGMIVLLCVLGVTILFFKLRNRLYRYIVLIGFLTILYALLVYFAGFPEFWNKWSSYLSRSDYWKAAFQMFACKPFWGWGPGLFGSVYSQFKMWGAEETQMVHNNYLQILSETGILGFLFFCFFWGGLFWISVKSLAHQDGFDKVLGLGLLGFIIHGFIDFDFYVPANTIIAFSLAGFMTFQVQEKIETEPKRSTLFQKGILISLFFLFLWVSFWEGQKIYAQWNFQVALEKTKQTQWMEAEDDLKKSITLDRLNPSFNYKLGSFYEEQKNITNAVVYFQRAVELNPAIPYYHVSLAHAYYQMGEVYFQKSKQELEKAVNSYPTNQSYRLAYADFLERQGDDSEALVQYQKILSFQPNISFIRDRTEKIQKRIREK